MAHKFGSREARASLFVRGIPFHIRRSQLEQVFAHHGEIRDVYIPLDYYTREPRGFAYIEFEDERDSRYALKELDGARLWGQTIHIEWAKSDRKTPKEMRRQTNTETPRRGGYGRRGPPRGGYGRDSYMPSNNSYGPPNHYNDIRGGGGMGSGRGGRYPSYSRSPSRERGRPIRRRRRSRSMSSSSYSSSYSEKKMGKVSNNQDPLSGINSKRRRDRRNSYSRSRSRSYSSSSSYSSDSRSRDSNKQNNINNNNDNNNAATTVTDLSNVQNNQTGIQPDLPMNNVDNNNNNILNEEDINKKAKHKKKRKHKHRHHRRHHSGDGSRRHKHKHRHKKRKEKLNDEIANQNDNVETNVNNGSQ